MFQYHNNVLCVQASWLFKEQIVSMDLYKKLCQRGHFTKMAKGGNGRKALIEFQSMREQEKTKIIELVGDPTEKAKHITFVDYIKDDSKAKDFFNRFTLENGEELPAPRIKEYYANAIIFNACNEIINSTMSKRKALGSKVRPWEKISVIVSELPKHTWPHSLPENARSLQNKFNIYKKEGYQSLVHKLYCHKNAEKINEDAKSWVLARWCDRVDKCASLSQLLREYNDMAADREWKTLKSENTLFKFLQGLEHKWHQYRFGELSSKEKYSYQHSTILAGMRDSLWYSDGTKLNYYYQDENGKMKTCQVYEVFDTYSEVFLGYHISDTEDFEAQYYAFKMALQISGHKPFEIKFDNQGGTKKLQANSFLGSISRIARNTQPYNGKSKTIENAFARFQTQFLKRDWFFTGQNITAKKLESKSNMEMILQNKSDLPTLSEIKDVYKKRREEWNAAPHPKTGKPRLEMYLSSSNPETTPLSIWDMVDMFWIKREKPVTCTAYGISFTEKKIEHTYMVYNNERMPDINWLRENVDRKFIIKYDPDDMTLIHLYEETPLGLRRVASAEPKVKIHRNSQEQEEFEASYIKQIEIANKNLRIESRDEVENVLAAHNMTVESYGLKSPVLRGIESSRKQKKKTDGTDIGQFQKNVSNMVPVENNDNKNDVYSIM